MIEASIIIATYNRAERLRACLELLCEQTQPGTDFEVVVVVDGSTDGTNEMLAAFQSPYSLRVVHQPNSGQCIALNKGAEAALSRICIFLDDDVMASPRLVAEHLRLHREREQVVGIGQLTLTLPPRADWFAQCYAQEWSEHYAQLNQGRRHPDWEDCYGGNMSVARAAFLEVGGLAVDLPRAYDLELAYRLARHGYSFVYLPEALGKQDQRKGLHALAEDSERAGAACVEIYRRHPPVLKVLGAFPEQRPIWALSWRLFMALDISPHSLEGFRRLLGRHTETYACYRFISRYCFWRGVRRALPNRDTWHRLTYGTPILMYHAFGTSDKPPSRYVVPVRRFKWQMAWLKWMGYQVLSLGEFLRYRREYRLPPARSVVITMDDGYSDNWSLAFPILRRFHFPATVFLVSNKVEGVNDWDEQDELAGRPLLSWPNIQEMLQGGVHFGSHSRTHPDLMTCSPEQAQEEIEGSRADLERNLGAPTLVFSYPYGKHNEMIDAIVKQSGFLGSCGINSGSNTPVTPLHALRRVEIWGTDSMLQFAHALRYSTRTGSLSRRKNQR